MQSGNQRASNSAQDRRGLGVIIGALGAAGAAIVFVAYFFGIAAGDVLNIAAQVGVQR